MKPGGENRPCRRCEELPHLYHSLEVSHTNAGLYVFKIKKRGKNLWFSGIKSLWEVSSDCHDPDYWYDWWLTEKGWLILSYK